MNPILFALRHPISVMVAMVALAGGGVLALSRMKVDIFPSLNLPVVYVCQPYGGMDPAQMEGLLANYYEYHFLYISGIHHVESKNIQGVSLMKLFFHPGTDMAQAMAETVGYVNRSRAFMPPGTVPPFIMRFDTGSVPVGYLVLSSETRTIGQIQDQALFKVRPMFASIPGVSAPPPFGGNQRTVVIRVDPDRLRAYQVSPEDVVRALVSGNTISPSGNIRIQEQMPVVPVNSMVIRPQELGDIPLSAAKGPGEGRVFLRDVAPLIEDATDIPTGYALVNGKRAVYILATKRADASTLSVVNGIKANLPKMQAALPEDIKVSFEFDQSPYVTGAIGNVAFEALLGAVLVGLMVLLFLRDWRSVIVVVLNIPLALIGSVIALALSGQTINLMTLGGLALAVGILVDEATVEVENIHTQLERTDSVALAVRRGNSETAVPRLLAMLCIVAVFLPSFFMQGAAQALFVPLSLAVGFAMISSYLLSSSLVPVLSVWLLKKNHGKHGKKTESIADRTTPPGWTSFRVFRVFRGFSPARWRWAVVPAYVLVAGAGIVLLGRQLGTEIFPPVDRGQFQFRLRAPAGTRIEQTEAITQEALEFIKREVGADNIQLSLGYIGVVPSSYPINSVYLWTGGPEEAVMRVSLKRGVLPIEEVKRRLREKLPDHLHLWVASKWRAEGVPDARLERVRDLRLSFEPADIINDVMSFGSPTPVEVVVSGPKLADNRAFSEKLREQLEAVPSLRDLQFAQALDYPTVEVRIDREKAGFSNVTAEDVARSVVAATSSSRFVVPNYWRDPASGIGYQVQVEIPQALMNSIKELETVPVKHFNGQQRLLRDVASVREGTMPGEYARYNMRRLVSMTANVEGDDLGRVAGDIARAIEAAGEPPRGVEVDVRGQVTPMQEMFRGLGLGLALAVAAILALLTAYFQSLRLALVALASVPAALLGVILALLLTGTTLNLQSFMGAIMAMGVAVANAILFVTFAERYRVENGGDAVRAGVEGARSRARAILMTSAAMIAGMLPLALGLGEGGDQAGPLGRAVIGGLLAATATTLLILPSVFAVVMGGASTDSVSLDPDDPASRHFVGAH
ncbi:MAG: efflux RND transporter permease subunit [Gemmataceae bacterium]|nr:efflux RND transporter permease subunit [Gemmataceae bacterium]